MCVFVLTSVNEELIGHSRVVYIMDSCSKQSSKDLQVSEDSLKETENREDRFRELK